MTETKETSKEGALRVYKGELAVDPTFDLGVKSPSRARLRVFASQSVIDSTRKIKKKYSFSQGSSQHSSVNIEGQTGVNALKMLMKERLIVSRLGFPEKAKELDEQIDIMRGKATDEKKQEEIDIIEQRMKLLRISHKRKEDRLEYTLNLETQALMEQFAHEEQHLLDRQEQNFSKMLEVASRAAMGKPKKCTCRDPYTCQHNKIASYNSRKPAKVVIEYRKNAKRLKHAGRPEEAQIWEEKASRIDDVDQEKWCKRIAWSIVSSPWGANEAIVDKMTEDHKRELAVLRKTHEFRRHQHDTNHERRRLNFRNVMVAEERKVRMQCRKLALMRQMGSFKDLEDGGESSMEQKEGDMQRNKDEKSRKMLALVDQQQGDPMANPALVETGAGAGAGVVASSSSYGSGGGDSGGHTNTGDNNSNGGFPPKIGGGEMADNGSNNASIIGFDLEKMSLTADPSTPAPPSTYQTSTCPAPTYPQQPPSQQPYEQPYEQPYQQQYQQPSQPLTSTRYTSSTSHVEELQARIAQQKQLLATAGAQPPATPTPTSQSYRAGKHLVDGGMGQAGDVGKGMSDGEEGDGGSVGNTTVTATVADIWGDSTDDVDEGEEDD